MRALEPQIERRAVSDHTKEVLPGGCCWAWVNNWASAPTEVGASRFFQSRSAIGPAFTDSAAAAKGAATAKYKLVILSNIDDDLFAYSAPAPGGDLRRYHHRPASFARIKAVPQ